MAKTAKRLAGPLLVTNSVVTRYTVPASTKTIIRHIHIQNNSGSAATFTASIGADAAGTRIFDAYSIPANSVQDYFGYWVMDAAEIFQTNSGTTNVLNITLNGDELTLG
jgi:hypothetical protein